ncbi:MAG: hypothetical protein KGL52_15480 [Rhodospirillales bacterium]|jgi:flagellar motility protein MotE (MotC chaperone)|nr:hypothetical protein [Rhodospirillales bacterium]
MTITAPRVLPAVIVAISALLGMKAVGLVQAIAPAVAASVASAHPAAHTARPAQPAPTARVVPPPPPAPAISPEEQSLLQDLRRRREALDARAKALAAREALLTAAERRLDQRVAELRTLQASLQKLEAARRRHAQDAWSGLVKLYQSMKPRQAAKIFDQLNMPVLLAVVNRMDARRAAAILAAMQPDRAREVTDRLAALRLGDNPEQATTQTASAPPASTPPAAAPVGSPGRGG